MFQLDAATSKTIFFAIFNAGMIWGGIRAGQKHAKERSLRQGRAITRLLQYKAWSHRAISVMIAFHRQNHPGQNIIEDWNEINEGAETNGNT